MFIKPPDGVHTIYVPRGWTPEQAWEAIRRDEVDERIDLDEPGAGWANIVVEGGQFVELLPTEEDA